MTQAVQEPRLEIAGAQAHLKLRALAQGLGLPEVTEGLQRTLQDDQALDEDEFGQRLEADLLRRDALEAGMGFFDRLLRPVGGEQAVPLLDQVVSDTLPVFQLEYLSVLMEYFRRLMDSYRRRAECLSIQMASLRRQMLLPPSHDLRLGQRVPRWYGGFKHPRFSSRIDAKHGRVYADRRPAGAHRGQADERLQVWMPGGELAYRLLSLPVYLAEKVTALELGAE